MPIEVGYRAKTDFFTPGKGYLFGDRRREGPVQAGAEELCRSPGKPSM